MHICVSLAIGEWTWTRKGDGPAPRCSHVAFELNGKMGILAGFDGVATIYTHPLIYDLGEIDIQIAPNVEEC